MRVFGSLNNRIMEGKYPTPKVGDGATILMFTDRAPATVVEVISATKVVIQYDDFERTDKNGMSESQEYKYSPNQFGTKMTVTLRKNGRWIVEGEAMRNGTAVAFGIREKYYDFSF